MNDLMMSMPLSSTASVTTPASQAVSTDGLAELDVSAFGRSLDMAANKASQSAGATEAPELTRIEKAVAKPLDYLNNEAAEIAQYAEKAVSNGNTLSPSEIVTLTARSQEFMFHAQLTANVANRTSEGLQQLFRQQG